MARQRRDPQTTRMRRPARPLFGYRDVGADVRHSRTSVTRAWVILAILILIYFGWTLTVYFLEPGLR
jgi:hypothetical protein